MKGADISAADRPIRFTSGTVTFYPSRFVFHRLQGLHRRAISGEQMGTALVYPRRKAQKAYARILHCAMGTYLIASNAARDRFFRGLLKYLESTRSLDGLEALFLSGLNTAGAARQSSLLYRGVTIWQKLGPPAKIGGGMRIAPVLDTTRNAFFFIGERGIRRANVVSTRVTPGVTDPIGASSIVWMEKESLLEAGIAADGMDACETIFKYGAAAVVGLGGAVYGGLQGGVAGSTTGLGAVGGAIGAVGGAVGVGGPAAYGGYKLGESVGGDVCGWIAGETATKEGSIEWDEGIEVDTGTDEDVDSGTDEGVDTGTDEGTDSGTDTGADEGTDSGTDTGADEGTDSGTDDDSDGDNGDGMPNPDDPDGFPNPEDPRGYQLRTTGIASKGSLKLFISRAGMGFVLKSVPQLGDSGFLGYGSPAAKAGAIKG